MACVNKQMKFSLKPWYSETGWLPLICCIFKALSSLFVLPSFFSSHTLIPLCWGPHLFQVHLTWPWERCCIAGDPLLYKGLVAECCPRFLELFVVELLSRVVWSISPKRARVIEPICLGYVSLFLHFEISVFLHPFQLFQKLRLRIKLSWAQKTFYHSESNLHHWCHKRMISRLSWRAPAFLFIRCNFMLTIDTL